MNSYAKFKTEFIEESIIKFKELDILSFWCNRFSLNDLAPTHETGSFGNLSFRISPDKNEFVITASGIDLGRVLSNRDFVHVIDSDLSTNTVKAIGVKEPSSESLLHHEIYKLRPEVNAIFHGHCPGILESARYLNYIETRKEFAYGTVELVNEVIEIATNTDFLIMKNHGFIAMGKDMDQAGNLSIEAKNRCSI